MYILKKIFFIIILQIIVFNWIEIFFMLHVHVIHVHMSTAKRGHFYVFMLILKSVIGVQTLEMIIIALSLKLPP